MMPLKENTLFGWRKLDEFKNEKSKNYNANKILQSIGKKTSFSAITDTLLKKY
jgi:hypothetical protein